MTQAISAALFSPHLNSTFAFAVPGYGSLDLKLTAVSEEKACGPFVSFHLVFQGPVPLLPQAVYLTRQENLGEQELFLVPVGDIKDEQGVVTGYEYQSCFSVKPAEAAN